MPRPFNNDIVTVENFISKEELEYMHFVISKLDKDKWSESNDKVNARLADRFMEFKQVPEFVPIWNRMEPELSQLLFEEYGLSGYLEIPLMKRHFDQSYLDVHWDDRRERDQFGMRDPISHGLVIYLNDDYEGGEIFYPELGIEYKAKAGELLIHPGSKMYSHGVKPVSSGYRINVTSFLRVPDLK